MKRFHVVLVMFGLVVFVGAVKPYRWPMVSPLVRRLLDRRTVNERLAQYGAAARARLAPSFEAAGVEYPPQRLWFVGLKHEERLEVYAAGRSGKPKFIRAYRLTATSGELGPKLRYGDGQIPEGFYRVDSLNPNSHHHLALHLNYPNEFDRAMGRRDGRRNLGRNIMIHGGSASVGCLAVGDRAAEDLFVLAADTGVDSIQVVLSPVDFRRRDLPSATTPRPAWVAGLYADIREALEKLPLPAGR